jgi:hypothetical protein
MRKAAIIFLAKKWDSSYSLTSVVKSQISSLAGHGYRTRVLTLQDCPPWKFPGRVDYRNVIPHIKYGGTEGLNRQIRKKIKNTSLILAKNLKGIDLVFTHDLIFLKTLLPYNLAFRDIAGKMKNISWFHWCHSSPDKPGKITYPGSLLYKKIPNSHIVSVSYAHRKGLARMFDMPLKKVITVHNPRFNGEFLGLNKLTGGIVKKTGLLNADIVSLAPGALSRIIKQPAICLYIMAALKNEGKGVRMIFADPPAHDPVEEKAHLLHLRWLAQKLGLTDKEVFFTSEMDRRLKNGCPEPVIRELFHLTNIYIHPSLFEACSLSLLEAGATKNLCVLNKRLAAFKEIAGKNAIWADFDDIVKQIKRGGKISGHSGIFNRYYKYYEARKKNYRSLAREIIRALDNDPALSLFIKVKKEFNDEFIFNKQIRPLLEHA